MKIALIGAIDSPIIKNATAGTEIWTYNYAETLVKRGHRVGLFANKESRFSGELIGTCSMADINKDDGTAISKPKFVLFSVDQMAEVIKRQNDFDLIHLSVFSFHYVLPLTKLIKKPFFITVHGSPFNYNEAKLVLSKYSDPHYVLISNDFARRWPKPEKFRVIANGIEMKNFDYCDDPDDYFFWMSRLSPEKGADMAIKFAKKAGQKLIIAGPIRDKDYFDKEIKPHLNRKIRYVGELGLKDKIEYYRKARAFIFPIRWDEPFGLVVVEALACGTPVIASDIGAMPDIIKDGTNGFLVKAEKVNEFVRASKNLDRIDRKVCRQSVENKYSLETMVDQYENYYRKVITNGK